MSEKAKKVLNVIVNIVVGIIIVIVLLLAINIISSKSKGYTSLFGKAFLVVQTDSMNGDYEDSFAAGDLIIIDVLSDEEKQNLQVGDIVTFYTNIVNESTIDLNSHRIQEVREVGGTVTYITKGDANEVSESVAASAIIGKVIGNMGQIGKVIDWMSSSTGYFVCIVIPSFLVVAYFAVNLVVVIRDNKREKVLASGDLAEMTPEEREAYKEKMKADMKADMEAEMEAELRAKLLAEMQAEKAESVEKAEQTETAEAVEKTETDNNTKSE